MLENISQIAIFIMGVFSIFLISNKNKWGFVVGLLSEPFWFYTSIHNKQWGLFAITVVYLFVWSWGIYKWFKEE